MAIAPPEPPQPRKAWGAASHQGDAIARVAEEAGGRQVAAILLFSDGQSTGGLSLAEAAQKTGGAPVFVIPPGKAPRLKDIAIVDVFTSGLASLGDTVQVTVALESQGFDGRKVTVELADGESGIAPGQACVLYTDDGNEARVLGGGFIERSERGAEAERMLSRLAATPLHSSAA